MAETLAAAILFSLVYPLKMFRQQAGLLCFSHLIIMKISLFESIDFGAFEIAINRFMVNRHITIIQVVVIVSLRKGERLLRS